jgi:hypothetical protein
MVLMIGAAAVVVLGAIVWAARVARARRAEGEALDRELQGMLGTATGDGPWAGVSHAQQPRTTSSHRAAGVVCAGVLLLSRAYGQGVVAPVMSAVSLNVMVLTRVLRQRPVLHATTTEPPAVVSVA